MKTLYLECNMGAAGDMIAGSLFDLVEDPKKILEKLNNMGLEGVKFELEKAQSNLIEGNHFKVIVHGEMEESIDVPSHDHHHHDHEEEHDCCHHHHDHEEDHDCCHHHHDHEEDHDCCHHHHEHEEDHHHGHHHVHRSLSGVQEIINNLQVSDWVKRNAFEVYELIAKAEGKAHGMHMDEIHFHEVGTLDAIGDVVAGCVLLEEIHPDQILASSIRVGFGSVKCAHGILPVPAPATSYLLEGMPIYAGDIEGELCTPTGAAMLKHFVEEFETMPVMKLEKTGLGMGMKKFKNANVLRAFLGTTDQKADDVMEFACTIDDMNGEEIGYVIEKALEKGALDAYWKSVGMKKSRPGIELTLLCKPKDEEAFITFLFKHTSTLGIRKKLVSREVLKRSFEVVSTPYGDVVKKVSEGFGLRKEKIEFEDLKTIADETEKSVLEIKKEIEKML